MEGNLITRDRKIHKKKKTIRETIKRYLNFNGLNVNIIYDKIL